MTAPDTLADLRWNIAIRTVQADLLAAADAPTPELARLHVRDAVNLLRGVYGMKGVTDEQRKFIRGVLRRKVIRRAMTGKDV